METKFAEFMSNENERLERDVKQASEKAAADLAEREERRADEWAAICRSRTQQLDLRREHRERDQRADARFAAAWKVCGQAADAAWSARDRALVHVSGHRCSIEAWSLGGALLSGGPRQRDVKSVHLSPLRFRPGCPVRAAPRGGDRRGRRAHLQRPSVQGRTEELAQEEADAAAERRQCSAQVSEFQQRQAAQKQAAREKELVSRAQEAAMIQETTNDSDARFAQYAAEFIAEYERQGKPVKPMHVALSRPEPFVSA